MSTFKCEVVSVQIEPHPNADQIELARVGDYLSVVKKGQYKDGDLAVYIPEQAILPNWLLIQLGFWNDLNLKGKLNGGAGNRVRAMRLRGVLSQGLLLTGVQSKDLAVGGDLAIGGEPVNSAGEHDGPGSYVPVAYFNEGDDAAEFLGIIKYESTLPSHMVGRTLGVDFGATHGYDFENLKKLPKLFDDGEDVVITEKIHGTLMSVSVVPTAQANDKYYRGRVVLTSKGMGARGCILDHNDETNLYAQAAKKHGLLDAMLDHAGQLADDHDKPVFLFGEVFGRTLGGAGVQDLTYSGEPLDYRAFDICIGNRGNEKYMGWNEFVDSCGRLDVMHVPLMYRGPYSKDIVLAHTDGETIIGGGGKQIREGVVVKSANEERNKHFGRKIAKSVSAAYLTRKGEQTEFN